jgi:hypothetical protein
MWANLLWACTGCNRAKIDRFQLDAVGQPLFIDPTAEDPWAFLYFEPRTGSITARFNPESNAPDVRGEYTVRMLGLNHEAVTEGRSATRRNLERAVNAFLNAVQAGTPVGTAAEDLRASIRDNADHGLSVWYFQRDGAHESPFRDLQEAHPNVWLALQDVL